MRFSISFMGGGQVGVALVKKITRWFWFLITFCHNRNCGLAVAFNNYLLGCLPALLKIIPKTRDVGNNVVRPPPHPPFLLCCAMISYILIPAWGIGLCSGMGATLVFISISWNTKMCSGTTDCDKLSSTYSYVAHDENDSSHSCFVCLCLDMGFAWWCSPCHPLRPSSPHHYTSHTWISWQCSINWCAVAWLPRHDISCKY
jgi:hypothetical protein